MLDLGVLLIVIFFVFVGLRKGFWQYLLGLLITGISLTAGWLYYQNSQQVLTSLFLSICLFLGLALAKWFFLTIRQTIKRPRSTSSFANHLGGAILGFAWGILIAMLFIFTLKCFPLAAIFKYDLKQKLKVSRAYQIFQRLLPKSLSPALENLTYMSKVSLDEKAKLRLTEQAEFQQLSRHPHLKAILEDRKLLSQLEIMDLPRLLTNPRIHTLLNDGQFIEKLMKLNFKKALGE